MGCETNGYVQVNQYALVSYIENPLGKFLDDLRLRLAPECRPHAHVTVLPPRPLYASLERAQDDIRNIAGHFHSFEVKLGNVELFEATDVVYIEVERGTGELSRMHQELNVGAVEFKEPFQFHPHITLAQNLPHDQVPDILRHARELWAEWGGKRVFPVEELVFVQNTQQNIWLDLMHLPLTQPAGVIR